MDAMMKQRLFDKNRKITDMVIERAKRDFPDDIAAIGLFGSFTTGEYHEKSDLDLIILNATDKGWGIARSFILGDVGYDIYCTAWEKVPTLTHMEVFYCAKPEYHARIDEMISKKQKELAEPIGLQCVEKAQASLALAKQYYADMALAEDVGGARYASGLMLDKTIETLAQLNNTDIRKYGLHKYLETLLSFAYLPPEFEKHYMCLIDAKTVDDIKQASLSLLRGLLKLHDAMCAEFSEKPTPTYENLRGTYEELWSNCRNKVLRDAAREDKSYMFLSAIGAQNYLDEMTETRGTKKMDIMQYFDSDHFALFGDAFQKAMDDYLLEYQKVGRSVEKYDTFEQLYDAFMNQ